MLGKISAASFREYLHNADFFLPHRSSRSFQFLSQGYYNLSRWTEDQIRDMKFATTEANGQLHGALAKSNQMILGNQNYIAELSHLMCIKPEKG